MPERSAEGTICSVCGKRPGTVKWGDALAITHGFATWRCRRCAARPQLRHAVGRALRIPVLLWRAR